MTQKRLRDLLRRLAGRRPAQTKPSSPSTPKGQRQWDRQAKGIAHQLNAAGRVLDSQLTAGDAAAHALDEDLDLGRRQQRVAEELERLKREQQGRP